MSDFQRTYKILQEFASAAQAEYRKKLTDEGVSASGALLNSISATVDINGNMYTVYLSLEDYWKNIEYGRQPGKFPPVDAIRKWIAAKPILPTSDQNGKIPTDEQLSFLIGRKIARDGIPPRPLLSQTVEEVYNDFIDNLTEAFAADASEASFAIITSGISGNEFKTLITN